MKVKGSAQPQAAYSIEAQPKKQGVCLVRFYENVAEYTDDNASGWQYDEYHLEMPDTGGLAADVAANFDMLLLQAKTAELGATEAAKTVSQRKLEELSAACESAITAGIDVELSGGAEHFSLTGNDQTNIDGIFNAVVMGATEYPYHADGKACCMYSTADIITLYVAAKSYVTKQTTYHNMLKQWVKRETDNSVIAGISYGVDLPADLATHMQSILNQAAEQINAIVAKLNGNG